MSPEVENMYILYDYAGGQNKHYTVILYLHYMVCERKHFKSIVITYPVRGHSYLECDKNMGLINSKNTTQVPDDWVNVFESARAKPEPFIFIKNIEDVVVRDWHMFLTPRYIKKCMFETRPIKELKFVADHPQFATYCHAYNGAWTASLMTNRRSLRALQQQPVLEQGEFLHPPHAYEGSVHTITKKR